MRQFSAESREIDLMMRQWKPAKQTPAMSRPARAWATVGTMLPIFFSLFACTGPAQAQAPATDQAIAQAQPSSVVIQTRISLSAAEAADGSKTVLAAHVTDPSGHPLDAAGTVSFDYGSQSLGAAVLDHDGNATLTLSTLPATANGSPLAVRAVYHPGLIASEPTLAASVSAPAHLQADASAVPTFALAINPASLSVTAGQYAIATVTVTPSNGFSEQVSLSCENLPTQATCTFSPVIASTANGPFTSTLEIQTQAASGALTPPDFGVGHRDHVAFAWLLPGALALAGFASLRRRALGRKFHATGLMLVLLAAGLGLSGCSTRYGYIHHPPSVATGTLPGTYTIAVYASGNNGSSVTQQSMNITLQVK
jgi:hypothetical protein